MSGSLLKVGFLVPLNEDCEESEGVLKIPIFEGLNVIGRSDLSVSDKQVSRKHISLTAKDDGFLEVVVEGPNPIIVKSGHQRTKICSKDKTLIAHGDILQLIPGRLNFKLVTLCSKYHASPSMINGRISNEGDKLPKEENMRSKRKRQDVEDNALEQTFQGQQGDNNNSSSRPVKEQETLSQFSRVVGSHDNNNNNGGQQQAIREFRVDKNLEPLTFQLLRVQGLPRRANTSSTSIENVVEGNVIVAIISNYMVDMDWFLSACPNLRKIPHGLIIHGESDGRAEHIKKIKPAGWVLHRPPLPISYGTHHSKAMLLIYPQGVRVVVHTANLIYVDWNNKTQGLWMQDFPWKDQKDLSSSSPFENDLIEYLMALKLPEVNVNLPALGSAKISASFFRRFDYSSASVRLIASVPGYHKGSNLRKWGHMKLRSILQDCIFHKEFQRSPLVYQFSSLGSLDEKWMAELASSMSSGLLEDKTPLGLGKAMIIWPTVEDVRCSLEGYAAGSAIPSPEKNVEKDFLKKYWARWKADHTGRGRAMPHIKSYTRYNGQNLAWFILTSANLSKAAWGALQKNNSQLMIRSYELGILFLPPVIKAKSNVFSCTDNGSSNKGNHDPVQSSDGCKTKLLTLCAEENDATGPSSTLVQLPVPYELPPQPYTNEDVPWSWDRRYHKKDVYGHTWPLRVQHYTNEET